MRAVKPILAVVALLCGLWFIAVPSPTVQHFRHRKPVIFWHMWTAEWKPRVEEIARRFNESQTEYEVIPLSIPSGQAEEKFLTAAAGGSVPDLVSQWNPVLGMWTERGLIQPVEDVMTRAELDRYKREAYPIFVKHGTYGGKLMAVVPGIDEGCVFYRMDHLKEVGVDKAHLPQTLEELVALGHKLDRKDSSGTLIRVGFLPNGFENYSPSFKGTFNKGGKLVIDTPENLRALKFISAETKRLGYDAVTRFTSSQAADEGVNAPLIAGNYSIMLDGQWRVKQAADFAPGLDYWVTPLPPPAGGLPNASMTGPNLMLIPKGAKEARGAWEFIKYWIGFDDPEAGSVNESAMGWLPFSEKVRSCSGYRDYLRLYPRFKPFMDLVRSPNLEIPPQGPMQAFIMDQMKLANDAVSRGSKTPEQALKDMDQKVKSEESLQRSLGHIQ